MNTHTRKAGATPAAPARRRALGRARGATVLSEISIAAIVVMITAALAMVALAHTQIDDAVVIAARVAQLAAAIAAVALTAAVLTTAARRHDAQDHAGAPAPAPERPRTGRRRRPRRRCSCPEPRRSR